MLKSTITRQSQLLVRFHSTDISGPWIKVLFITSMWPDEERSHYGTFIHTQAQSLEECGVGVDVIAIRGYQSSVAYIFARPRIRALVASGNYDIVHVHTGHAAVVGLPRVRLPSVLSFVGGDVLGNPTDKGTPIGSQLMAWFLRQLARQSTITITKSQQMEDVLPSGVRARNHIVPNGVDLKAFEPRPKAQIRRILGWEPTEQVVLFLGNPKDPRKNIALARAAVAELKKTGKRVRLHVGWGTIPADVPKLMWAADALVFPSLSEGSPNVVKEAMAAALPIVAAPVGDIAERLEGIAGCFVVRHDAREFAQALERALAFGRADEARAAVGNLTLTAVAQRLVALYEGLSGVSRPHTRHGESRSAI